MVKVNFQLRNWCGYDKLKHDFSDNISEKYVFKGLGCFSTPPRIVTGEDYNERSMSIFDSDVHIFICNIGKFDKESANMKKENELIGGSFYELLSNLPDLVLIMDESHHYRAEKGMQALNELHPVLGLELTATPLISKPELFRIILEKLRQKPEIDYEKCSSLLFSLITQVCDHYENLYGTKGMQNIVMMYKRDIANKIYKQMMQHFYRENGFLTEEVIDTRDYNLRQSYSWKECANLYEPYSQKIQSVLFTGIHKGVFSTAKFDSAEGELVLAKVLESDDNVINWLRPAPKEFNITYNHGKSYEPDFVVETEDTLYMVEVKAEKAVNDPDVIAKKNRALKYCQVATDWSKANGYKPWHYLFIPAKQVQINSTFMQLAERFCE